MLKSTGVLGAIFLIVSATAAVGQSSGGGGGAGGGGGSGGGGAGAGASSGSAGTGAGAGTGPGAAGRATSPTGPTGSRPGATGLQRQSPSVPAAREQQRTGVRDVPSVDNAEPTSPVNRLDQGAPGGQRPESLPPSERTRAPNQDPVIGGSGGSGGRSGRGVDPGTDVSGKQTSETISAEPERIIREGGAAGRSLDECLELWDPDTHMDKEQWKVTCQRLGK